MAATDANTYPGAGVLSETIMTFLDYLKPQYWNEIAARFGYQFDGVWQILGSMGREEPVGADEFYAYEENRYRRSISGTPDTITPGVGGTVVFTLDAADHEQSGAISFPRKWDEVLTTTEVPCWISAKDVTTPDAHTITITPVFATDNIGNLTGKKLIIFSGAKAAGMSQGDSTFVGATKRKFVAQIIPEDVGVEGTQLVNTEWFNVIDDGRSISGWYNPGLMRAEYFLNSKIDGAFTWGKENTNSVTQTTARGSVNLVKTTKGMLQWITELGKSMSITGGAYAPADLDTTALHMKQNGVTSGVAIAFCGSNALIDIRNSLKDLIDTNGTDYTKVLKTMFGGASVELGLSINFKTYTSGDMTYIFKEVPAWIDPTTYGETGFNMSKHVVIGPLEMYPNPDNPGKMLPNIGMRYRAKGNYSRRAEVWNTAGAGGAAYYPYNTDIDEVMLHLRSHVMFVMLKANRWIIQRGT